MAQCCSLIICYLKVKYDELIRNVEKKKFMQKSMFHHYRLKS